MTAERTLRDLLGSQARRFPKRPFLEAGEERYSFSAVDDRTDRAATALVAMGLRGGERVALLLTNRSELLFFLLGAPKVAVIPVLLDALAPAEEIGACLRAVNPSVVITETCFDDYRESFPDLKGWVAVDGEEFGEEPFCGLSRGNVLGFWPELDAGKTAAEFCRFAGGAVRSVALTHRDLLASCGRLLQTFRINESDRFLCVLPAHSVEAVVSLVLAPWAAGATCVLADAHPSRIVEEIVDSRATVLFGDAKLFQLLAGSRSFAAADLATLRVAVSHSGPVGSSLLELFEERYDTLVVEGLGFAETGGLAFANPYTGVRKPGSVGRALPGLESRIVTPDGKQVAPGEAGEIVLRGVGVMPGIPGSEGALPSDGGWLHTGLRAHADADGYIFLHGEAG